MSLFDIIIVNKNIKGKPSDKTIIKNFKYSNTYQLIRDLQKNDVQGLKVKKQQDVYFKPLNMNLAIASIEGMDLNYDSISLVIMTNEQDETLWYINNFIKSIKDVQTLYKLWITIRDIQQGVENQETQELINLLQGIIFLKTRQIYTFADLQNIYYSIN